MSKFNESKRPYAPLLNPDVDTDDEESLNDMTGDTELDFNTEHRSWMEEGPLDGYEHSDEDIEAGNGDLYYDSF